jgi:drug/metabolite transporter (DMT)-like permease
VAGLVLVLDLVSGADLDPVGVLWALGAMLAVTFYWLISADERSGLPPLVLAAGGLLVGAAGLLLAGLVGVLDFHASTGPASYSGREVPWWLPVVALGLVTAAVAYVSGVAAARRLGARMASFFGLTEVLAAFAFGWLLLGEMPRGIQLLGGLMVLAGVVAVKAGERRERSVGRAPDRPSGRLRR